MELAWAAATSVRVFSHWLLLWHLGVIWFVLLPGTTCKCCFSIFPAVMLIPLKLVLSSLTIWRCFIKLILKAGFQAAGALPCLYASIFEGDLGYGNCLLLPRITCELPTALSQPVACTRMCVHTDVKYNDVCVLGNIVSIRGRLAESVPSSSPLAFSAELLLWVIKPSLYLHLYY